jgi:hypothetical protein
VTDEVTKEQRLLLEDVREVAPELKHLLSVWQSSSARYVACVARDEPITDAGRRGALTQMLNASQSIDDIIRRYYEDHLSGG